MFGIVTPIMILLLVTGSLPVAAGDCLKGECENGFGRFKAADGTYEGHWRNGMLEGSGTFISNKGSVFKGEFHAGKMTGSFRVLYIGGRHYEGRLDDLKQPHGYGVYREKDVRYEGNWNHGRRHGSGKLYMTDGTVIDADWQHDQPVLGAGVWRFCNKTTQTTYVSIDAVFRQKQRKTSEGWFEIEPGACKSVERDFLKTRYRYFYAEHENPVFGKQRKWQAGDRPGIVFCTDTDRFTKTIPMADRNGSSCSRNQPRFTIVDTGPVIESYSHTTNLVK